MTNDDVGMLRIVVVKPVPEKYNDSVTIIAEAIPVTEGIGSIKNHRTN